MTADRPVFLLEENHDLPLCRVQVTTRTGAITDRPDAPGLCNFATELMRRGAAGRTRSQIDEALDSLGASLHVSCSRDAVTFEVMAIKDKLEQALSLLSDVLLRPDFPPIEADKLRRELLAHLDDLRDDDGALCWRFFSRALYGEHPYGRPISGTEQSIAALDIAGSVAWYREHLTTGNLVVGAAGDLTMDELLSIYDRHLGGIPAGPRRDAPVPEPRPIEGTRLTLVDKPERTQSQILIGQFAPRWHDPAWLPMRVAATAFGGTFTARLMDEVRVKRGLSYGASCRTGAGRGRPMLHVHVFPSAEQTAETLELVLSLYTQWAREGLTPREVEFARGYLSRSFAFRIETPEARLGLRTEVELCGAPPDYIQAFPARVQAVTPEQVRAAMDAVLRPQDLVITLVGTAATLQAPLAGVAALSGASTEILPFDSY